MLIVMKNDASVEQIDMICDVIKKMGYTPQSVPGVQRTTICVLGNKTRVDSSRIELMDGVKEVIHVTKPYKLVSHERNKEYRIVC